MKSFKQLMLESTGGNYVSMMVDDPKINIEISSGTIVPPGKHHVTLMYSEGSDIPEERIRKKIEWMTGNRSVVSKKAEVFDSQEDPSLGCVVLTVESYHLHNIHGELRRLGMKHSYSEFKPHVTLAYDVDIEEARRVANDLNKTLSTTPCVLILHGLEVAPIKENWSDSL